MGGTPALQAKLRIGSSNDAFEHEAESVAASVMRMPEPSVQRTCAACSQEDQIRVRRKQSATPTPEFAPAIVSETISGGGSPLDSSVRSFMEPRFGHDFSDVRVHTDSQAAESARSITARAYAVGNNLVFGEGEYRPDTESGRRLIAHELTHTLQQGGVSGGNGSAPVTANASVVARVPAERGGVPCAPEAYRAEYRTVELQPVSFKSSATDASPTGASWTRRFNEANRIWGKVGVTFTALSTVEIVDAARKTASGLRSPISTTYALHTAAPVSRSSWSTTT